MSPDNTHKLIFYIEVLILGVNTMYMLFCFFKLFLIGCIGSMPNPPPPPPCMGLYGNLQHVVKAILQHLIPDPVCCAHEEDRCSALSVRPYSPPLPVSIMQET